MDSDLRALEIASKSNPSDQWARYRYRVALVRAGRGEEAGIEVGDEVEIGRCLPGGEIWGGSEAPVRAIVTKATKREDMFEDHHPWLFTPKKPDGPWWNFPMGALEARPVVLIHPSKPSEVGT